jgi:hypothetical protein
VCNRAELFKGTHRRYRGDLLRHGRKGADFRRRVASVIDAFKPTREQGAGGCKSLGCMDAKPGARTEFCEIKDGL